MRQITKLVDRENVNCGQQQQRQLLDELNRNLYTEIEYLKEKIILLEKDIQTLMDEKNLLKLSKQELQRKNQQLLSLLMNEKCSNMEIGFIKQIATNDDDFDPIVHLENR
ncbi:hypothetical protein BLA29_012413 [Euroglyphus maynei]|uniref:Uncharacterized protein n=1 Tax=Euroglyphus maynei TaxID=6958 RepID=A0A1Y3B4D0_EURMA|nr:hypothetical protein BLA29_012413 [Euroglyphus maynei]